MRPPRPPRDDKRPNRQRPGTDRPVKSHPPKGRPRKAAAEGEGASADKPLRAKSPSASARDARRAADHALRTGKPRATPRPKDGVAKAGATGTPARDTRPRRGAARLERAAVPARPATPVAPGEGDRIAKLLARAGIASRREIERMIAEGRIAIGEDVVETPATILKSLAGVTVDGKPVAAPEPTRLFRFHKPNGVLTTERDPRGRATIYDRLPRGLPRLVPVGRLDLNTEGLLLLTTDGGLKRQLELPATGVERSYRARVFGEVSQAMLEDLIEGVEIEGVRYGSIDANLERRTGRNAWVEMKLKEGKNREVRRVLEYLGLQVSRLIRTSYGPFRLGDLPVGAVDEVLQHELVAFRKTLK